MEKLDLKARMKSYWRPPVGAFELVDVPPLNFFMVDGSGDPNVAPSYAAAITCLYTLSYTAKFMSKATGTDFSVAPLEALWWADDMSDFAAGRKDRWHWTAMIMQPEVVTRTMFETAIDKGREKLGELPPSVRFETFTEGLSVQTMHLGPYAEEGPTIARLHAFIAANGLAPQGHHHEIYVGDPRRSAPEKLRTIIRQPVRRIVGVGHGAASSSESTTSPAPAARKYSVQKLTSDFMRAGGNALRSPLPARPTPKA